MTERWGAVYLWESREAADQELPSRVRELIGKEPGVGEEFDVEATIEGQYVLAPARPGDIRHFAVDNTKLRRLGVDFDTDWRSIVREVIASIDPAAAPAPLSKT